MFTFKNKYFLIIESIKDIDLRNIKLINKYTIIYRNVGKIKNIDDLLKFRRNCKAKKIDFYVSNNEKLTLDLKADGIYISAHNKNLSLAKLKRSNFKIIGSAHNIKELNIKLLQGCTSIIFSRLFRVSNPLKRSFMGIIKFNLIRLSRKENLVPLGGINLSNLNKLKMVKSNSFALLSEIKKKPAKLFNRLF